MTNHPNRSRIIERDAEGLPLGSYEVSYYRVVGDLVRPVAGQDNGVPAGYVERLALAPLEIARAICRSQPGGATIYGSHHARDVAERSGWTR